MKAARWRATRRSNYTYPKYTITQHQHNFTASAQSSSAHPAYDTQVNALSFIMHPVSASFHQTINTCQASNSPLSPEAGDRNGNQKQIDLDRLFYIVIIE